MNFPPILSFAQDKYIAFFSPLVPLLYQWRRIISIVIASFIEPLNVKCNSMGLNVKLIQTIDPSSCIIVIIASLIPFPFLVVLGALSLFTGLRSIDWTYIHA